MKLKPNLTFSTGDFYYDMCEGYLKPERMCEDPEDAKRVDEALKVIVDFMDSCEEQIEGFVR
jgi:hypothetical protein